MRNFLQAVRRAVRIRRIQAIDFGGNRTWRKREPSDADVRLVHDGRRLGTHRLRGPA